MNTVVDLALPPRLGTSFRWLVASSWVSNLGDGIALSAGPLLVASQTRDPFLVALATLLQQLPTLLFGLFAGATADRLDRRHVVITSDLLRAGVLAVLATAVLTDHISITVVLVTLFGLGTAEVFADTSSRTLMPMLVEDKADYGIANARLFVGFIVANQLAGPPIGAALFAIGMTVPFASQSVLVAMGAVLVTRFRLPASEAPRERQHLRRDIAEGVRYLWENRPMRTLAVTIITFNVTYGAAWSVLVLYALERLHLHEVGYGLLSTSVGLGGIVGTLSYAWLEKHVSLANIMRGGLILETLTHLGLALTRSGWVAGAILFVFGAHAFVWSTTSQSVQQRAIPRQLQGRVGSVYAMGVVGGLVIGGLVGGLIAQEWGVVGPFWFAFAGSAVILVVIWQELGNIAHADEESRVHPIG